MNNELDGPALDLAVARAEGLNPYREMDGDKPIRRYWLVEIGGRPTIVGLKPKPFEGDASMRYSPSTNWRDGGPIIERERMDVSPEFVNGDFYGTWRAIVFGFADQGQRADATGPTPLIAAMRAFVASKTNPLDELTRLSQEARMEL